MIRRPPRSPLFPSPTLSRSLTADHLAIFRSVFGDAPSIPAAFIANPGAFLHHVGLNLFHTPKAVIEIFLAHYNVLLPRFRLFTAVEALLLGIALATALAIAWLRYQAPLPVQPRAPARV